MVRKEKFMTTKNITRLSIDLPSEDHKKLKMITTYLGLSIRDYVIQCVYEHMKTDAANVINKLTEKTFQKTDQNEDIIKANDASDLFKKLGI